MATDTPPLKYEVGATSANNATLISAPGSSARIVITFYCIQNESSSPTTIQLLAGSNAVARVLAQNQGDGLVANLDRSPLRMPSGTALTIGLSGANSCGYTVYYYIEQAN